MRDSFCCLASSSAEERLHSRASSCSKSSHSITFALSGSGNLLESEEGEEEEEEGLPRSMNELKRKDDLRVQEVATARRHRPSSTQLLQEEKPQETIGIPFSFSLLQKNGFGF